MVDFEDRPDFPSMAQVEAADREQLARWYRFLSSGPTDEQQRIFNRIGERFEAMGGMTKEVSNRIGFGGVESKKAARPN
jgi:hypothetical protein